MRSPALIAILSALTIASASCARDEGDAGPTPGATTGPTPVTQAQADEAMAGLCDIAAGQLPDMAATHEAFHGRAHQTLHAVAAQVREVDPAAAAALLEAKAVVEADLERSSLPGDFPAHAVALVGTFSNALEAIGLSPAVCLLLP